MGEAQMGLQARLMSQALRKLTGAVSKSKTCLIFINQLREKIGVMFGNPETTTGGRALKFYSSVRVDIRRIASDQGRRQRRRRPHAREGREEQGGAAVPRGRVRHHVRRGHLARRRPARPRRRASKIVEKSGAWFAYSGERLGQGRENAKQFLKDNPDTFKAIEEKVRKELGLNGAPPAAAEAADTPVAATAATARGGPRRRPLASWNVRRLRPTGPNRARRTQAPAARRQPGLDLGQPLCARIPLLSGAPR